LLRHLLRRLCLAASLSFLLLAFLISALAQAPADATKPLPPGPMQAKVKATCTACHKVGRITEQHFTRQQWSSEFEKMEGLGAVIPDEDRNAMLAYLAKNFGPEKNSGVGGAKAAPKKSGTTTE
jgi:hypothetical protein